MKNLELSLGRACNNACVFCATGMRSRADKGWMSLEQARQALERARAQGVESVGLLGGEPTRHPRITELVQAARDMGFARIAICTNGRSLSDPSRLEALLDAGLTRVALSIHSHKEALEDRITGRPGAFSEKLSAISHLVAAQEAGRLPFGFALNTVIHAQNMTVLGALAAFFKRRGARDIRFNFIRPEVPKEVAKLWVPTFSRTTPQLQALLARNARELRMHLTIADVPLCQLPWELLLSPELRRRYLGEARDLPTRVTMHRPPEKGPPREFSWPKQRATQLKEHLPPCGACPLRPLCEGVWRGYAEIHGEGDFEEGPSRALAWVGSVPE